MPQTQNLEEYAATLGTALETAVSATLLRPGIESWALLYSAGVDSALLAQICQDAGHTPPLLSLGTAESKDRVFIERAQAHLDQPVQYVTVNEAQIAEALKVTQARLQETTVLGKYERLNLIHLSLGISIYLVCQAAHQMGIHALLSAHGADALFAGFDRYHRVPAEDLPETLERDIYNTIHTGMVRDQAMADLFSIQLLAPFLEPDVVELALQIPVEFKLGSAGNKLVLRELARQRGVPQFITQRPKKSMQYSTGIWQIMRQLQQEKTP